MKMRSVLALIMAFVLMFLCIGNVFADANKEKGDEIPEEEVFHDGYYSYIISGKSAVIVGYSGKEADVVIPSKLGGLTVTGIRRNVFLDDWDIISVEIPASVNDISEEQFHLCPNMKEIRVASGNKVYTSVDGVLFMNKGKTIRFHPPAHSTEYVIPNGVTKIAPNAFFTNKDLEAISIPETVKEIGMCAFYDCEKIRTVVLPRKIKTVGQDAFAWCTNLKELDIPDTLSDIGRCAFYPTYATTHEENEFVILGKNVLIHYSGEDTDVEVPDGVQQIADAFYGNENIESVKLPDSVECISDHAFYGCSELLEVNIPSKIKKIGDWAFFGCVKLKSISIPEGAELGPYTFSCCYKIKEVSVDCKTIPMSAFERCQKLEEVNLGDKVKEIEAYSFYFCESLELMELPAKLKTIGSNALRRIGLEKLKLGEDIESIGKYAFWDNPNLILTVADGSYAYDYVKENNIKHEVVPASKKDKDNEKLKKDKNNKKKDKAESLFSTQNIIIGSSALAVIIAVVVAVVLVMKKKKQKTENINSESVGTDENS